MPNQSRRNFLKQSAAASALATSFGYWTSSLAAESAVASPNERLTWGALGTGDRWSSMGSKDRLAGVGEHAAKFGDFVAVCDVDASRKERARQLTGGKALMFEDYRRVLDRPEIEAVTIVTPDHWHTKMALDALAAGKDVYCEKPLTLTIDEGKQICAAVKSTGRVFQVGTQQRTEFDNRFVTAVAIAHSGRLGKIKKITVGIGAGPTSSALPAVTPPAYFNWDMWLGPAPWAEYRELSLKSDDPHAPPRLQTRSHYEFRWWYEYSGGKLTDWGAHHVDIAQWAMQLDHTGPVSVTPISVEFPVPYKDGYPTRDDQYNTPTKFKVLCKYAGGEELLIQENGRDRGFDNGILIEGESGRIFVNREKLTGKAVDEMKTNPLPSEIFDKLGKGQKPQSHMGNLVDCIKTRQQPVSDVFTHHRTMTTCHLSNIALRLSREIKWNPESEQIEGDDQARGFQSREPRKAYA